MLRDYDHGRDRVGWTSRLAEIPPAGNKVSIVMVAYERPLSLCSAIASIRAQTWDDWELLVMHDGPASDAIRSVVTQMDDARIQLLEGDSRTGAYGNHNRHRAETTIASGDWVLHTNDDNYYAPIFLESMLHVAATHDADLVYCNFIHSHYGWRPFDAKLKVSHIDYGAFMVRLPLARRVPWPDRTLYDADGFRAQDLKQAARRAAKCQAHLFVHN